jgi:hypothetical protein
LLAALQGKPFILRVLRVKTLGLNPTVPAGQRTITTYIPGAEALTKLALVG